MDKDRLLTLAKRLQELEDEINEELKKGLEREKKHSLCDFSKEKISILHYIASAKPSHILTAPIIYSMIIPAVIMDIFVSIYQAVCFRAYGIERVKRDEYIIIDRHKLPYLNLLQKLNCVYCGYFNGLIGYVQEIASRTEQYWCPIRHSKTPKGVHRRYLNFIEYGDGKNIKEAIEALREKISKNI